MACKSKKCSTGTKKSTRKRKKIISTEFVFYAPEAEKVCVVGDFNNWDPEKHPMRKFKSGICKKKIQIKPGCYEYLFLVDGEYCVDPENTNRKPNPYGTENCVLNIGEEVVKFC